MLKFKEFLSEEVNLSDFPEGVFGDLPVEKKNENSKTTVFVARSNDRLTDRDEIARNLRQAGLNSQVREKSGQSVDPVFIDSGFDTKIIILVKPLSGGIGETTLNSSITELFPAIAWETRYNPTENVDDFYDHLLKQDPKKLKSVNPKDLKAAIDTIQKASESSKFNEKMLNAVGVLKYIKNEESSKSIKMVHWGYRAKPKGVPKNHPGDIFLEFNDGTILGVSLKAGGKKTKEPKLNTYVNPIFNSFGQSRMIKSLRENLWDRVYSEIEGIPSKKAYDGSGRRQTSKALVDLFKKDSKRYERLYDESLDICRKAVIDLFNQDKDKTLDYIRSEILRDAPEVPTKVIKAVKNEYEEITADDELGVFLPLVRFIRAYASTTSKQNWFIDLKSKDSTVTMEMSIRTNKAGNAGSKKLGQFFNLSVKYNSLKVK
jgi:hypothetical protein